MLEQHVPWNSEWRPIPEFKGYYINQYGHVFDESNAELVPIYQNTAKEDRVKLPYIAERTGIRYVRRLSISVLLMRVFPKEREIV